MKNYADKTEDTLITFHIGRGGHFNNAGFLSYVDQDQEIDYYTGDLFVGFENFDEAMRKVSGRENLEQLLEDVRSEHEAEDFERRTGIDLGKRVYLDHNGNEVGLDFDNDGTGCINIDHDYNTTYVIRLKDCSERELHKIHESNRYVSGDVRSYVCDMLGVSHED